MQRFMKMSLRSSNERTRLFAAAGLLFVGLTGVACGELTGPISPSTPVNVTATLASPTSVLVRWQASPQSDGVVSYNVFRNGTKVGESTTTTYTDTGLAQQTTYMYTVSANCTAGVLSALSEETAAARVTTVDVTPPGVPVVQPPAGFVGVSPAATVTATFNEAIDPATLTPATFNLRITSSGVLIPGTITYNPATRVATFTPAASLPNPVQFTATLTTGVKDISGNGLANNVTWVFTTRDDTGPSVILISPANGAVGVSTSATVSVTFSEALDASTINATSFTLRATASGTVIPGTVVYNAATRVATFTPTSPLATNTAFTVTIAGTVRDVAGNQLGTTFQSMFTTGDNVPPTVVSTTPLDLATNVSPAVVLSATFSEAMDPASINAMTFTLRVTATGAPVAGTVAYNAPTTTATFTPSSPLAGGTTYTATITTGAKDAAGNGLASARTWTFITADNVPPTVRTVSPADSAINVATNTAVTVTFSKQINASTVNQMTFNVRNTGTGAPVAGVVTYSASNNTATFTPSGPLANSTNYTVTVTRGVTDTSGNPLASQFMSSFTTIPVPDTTRPTVVGTTPPRGEANVAVNTAVTVSFSEPMDASFITTSTVLLATTVGGTPVPGSVTYNATTNTATFTPSTPLANGTGYTITVTTGVRDTAGNRLLADFTSGFTTIADTTSPTVIARTPTAATGVSVSSTVTVTFSENMNPATINGMTFNVKTTTGGLPVAGTSSYNTATRMAIFTPAAPLAPGTSYTVTVTTGATDTTGNPLAGTFIFSFTTAP